MMNLDIPKPEHLYENIFTTASDGVLITDLETGGILAANPAAARMHGYSPEAFAGLRLPRLIQDQSSPQFTDFARTIQQGGLFEVLAQHVRQDGSPLSVEWRAVAIPHQGRTCALALLRDVSQRARAEFQDRQRAEVRAHEQTVLLEISQILASTLELQPELILDQLRVLIPYTRAGLFTLEDSTLVARSVRGAEPMEKSAPVRIRLSGAEGIPVLFNGHRPTRIADLSGDEPSAGILRTLLEDDSAALLEGAQSLMWVPLRVKNRMIGGIGITHAERDFFTPHHADLALTIANQAALTLVNAELYEHAQALAALQERQRLAQNLHDAVNQSLFSAGLIAEVLPRLWERDPDEARRSLEDLRRLTRGALAEMRGLLAELRPTTLTDSSLGDLLRQLANAFTGRTNVPVGVTVAGEPVLSAEVQVAFYRITQEALNNIAKHAGASRVEIEVRSGTGGLELHIRDNGRGFVTSDLAPAGHYGLGMMRERAEAAGIALTVIGRPGEGTEITLRWQEAPKQEAV
jgi:two-component system nitrate/nitrite sensor histidine kinase NarX